MGKEVTPRWVTPRLNTPRESFHTFENVAMNGAVWLMIAPPWGSRKQYRLHYPKVPCIQVE